MLRYLKVQLGEARSTAHFTEDDLRCQILGGSAKRPGSAFHSFRKAEICNLRKLKSRTTVKTIIVAASKA